MDSNLKIAVCISGINKNHSQCWPSIRDNLILPYNCDTFCSFWGKTEEECQKIYDDYKQVQLIDFEDFSSYKPIFEKWEWPHVMLEAHRDPVNALSMYYKIMHANHLRKFHEQRSGIKYSLIIRIRPDIRLDSIPKLPLDLKERILYSPSKNLCFGVNDQFYMAAPNTYDILADNMYYAYRKLGRWLPCHSELFLSLFAFFEGFGQGHFESDYTLMNNGGAATNNL